MRFAGNLMGYTTLSGRADSVRTRISFPIHVLKINHPPEVVKIFLKGQ
jgi:hypothetical protein